MKDSKLKDRIFEELLKQDDQTCEELAKKIGVTVEHETEKKARLLLKSRKSFIRLPLPSRNQ